MAFITSDDFKYKITDARLLQITGGDPLIEEEAINTAIAVVNDHIFERYDAVAIFATTGDNRPANVVRWCVNLILYYLYERIADKLIPERVVKNYNDTLADLAEIERGKKSADLTRLTDTDGDKTTKFRWGSSPANSH